MFDELVLSIMIYCPIARLPMAKVKATLLLDVSTFWYIDCAAEGVSVAEDDVIALGTVTRFALK